MNLIIRFRLWLAKKLCKKGMFYIGGPDVLPAPLAPACEAEYIAHIEEEASRTALVEHNLRLVAHVMNKS